MDALIFLLKVLFILAAVILMAAPFAMEFITFRKDKEKKITYKRFIILVYTALYVIAVTVLLFILKELVLWIGSLSFIQWLANKISVNARISYFTKVFAVIAVNFAIGFIFRILSKFVRIGLQKKNLVSPKKKNGDFTFLQKFERKIIRFFHNETWFFVKDILKYLNTALSIIYAVVFIAYQVPAVFGAGWIPYDFISSVFTAGYIYPTITLLALWEMYFFLEGIKLVDSECPGILDDDIEKKAKITADLKAIDDEIKKQYKDYYACDLDLSAMLTEELSSTEHEFVSKNIGDAVEHDKRNPEKKKEIYLDCLDRILKTDKSILINGGFFSEFSMYFLRYLSVIAARGDNIIFVCNSDTQIDEVYEYLKAGFSELSSLFYDKKSSDSFNFDDPIWRIIKVKGEKDQIEEASVDDNSILVTSLCYICSSRFEAEHGGFVALTDTIVFVDALKTVNTYNRQLAMLNSKLKQITKNNALDSKNAKKNKGFRVRYMSRQVRYVCFDHTRTSGLDKVLKNLLAVDFDSVDSMNYSPSAIVRCYNYEGRVNDRGRRSYTQNIKTDEEIGVMMNIARLCLAKGASSVTVFADDCVPYANFSETIDSHSGNSGNRSAGKSIRLNSPYYNPDNYSVIIAMDSESNLPSALRKWISTVSDKPALIIVFSKPYMLRDYYIDNLAEKWNVTQIERIPVEEGTEKDIAQRILVEANAGGISEEKILNLASGSPVFDEFVRNRDVNAILRAILKIYGITQDAYIDLFKIFEYSSSRDFDENGKYNPEDKVQLRDEYRLYKIISSRDMVVMKTNDSSIVLPMPKKRLTQNFIVDQNLLYEGNIYHIDNIDPAEGVIYTHLAVNGKNDEVYQYVQSREYRVEASDEKIEQTAQMKHVVMQSSDGDVSVSDVYLSVFRAPMEVLTDGYYEIDPHTLEINDPESRYIAINDPDNDGRAKQTYRRYGDVSSPSYSSDARLSKENPNLVFESKAKILSVRIAGKFGGDKDKTLALAAVMFNELLRSMFPSVSDSIAVCPVLSKPFDDALFQTILRKQPRITLTGEGKLVSADQFNLLIIEDSPTDLGVISVLMSAGDNVLHTLFNPIYEYLKWYSGSDEKSEYLYFGQGKEPECFDFSSLYKLSGLLGDDKHDVRFIDIATVTEYNVCDFCGKKYPKSDDFIELEDGRKMCAACAENLVGNNKKALKLHLERAKIFLESTYGIVLGDDYEFCFESTVKLTNMLKQNRSVLRRGTDIPLTSFVDGKKKVFIEYSIPSVNLSELLVRELTHVWQLKHLPDLSDDLAEGHIALVAVQYLRFLNQNALAAVRTTYYESTENTSGAGYRKLVRELIAHPEYNNNPFAYLIGMSGNVIEDEKIIPKKPEFVPGDFGLPYKPEQFDRVLDGSPEYFYRSRLTASCRKAYDAIVNAAANHEEKIAVEGCTIQDIGMITEAIEYDHPELFWYKYASFDGVSVNLFYGAGAEECAVLQKRIDEAAAKYLEGIDDSMSAYDVAIRLHVKLIQAVDYDTIALNKEKKKGGPDQDKIDYLRTICGVFINGKAVCEGYARALQYLLQKCGIECAEAAGYIRRKNGERNGGHAWNIVKIDGDYYYIDTTWDDGSNTVQEVKNTDLGFSYFCITTEELLRTRDTDMCKIELPVCSATRANYYYHNGLVIDKYDLNRIREAAAIFAKNNCKSFTFKCANKAIYNRAIAAMFNEGKDCIEALKAAGKADKRINTESYMYNFNKDIYTIRVFFKYK